MRFARATARRREAIALIIVMLAIFVLAMLAGGFAYSMKVETKLASNGNHETELEWIGRSGVEYARWILAQQMMIPNEPYDSLNQVWAGGSGGAGTTNTALTMVEKEVHLGNGSFTWKITDLERKFNINIANETILQQALLVMGVDAGEYPPIVGSILDWIDPDDNTHVEGAESDYYKTLTPPYMAKNGPIDDLSELLLVKGITAELYWGTSSSDHPIAAFQHLNRFGRPVAPPNYPVGLVDLFTPLSSGRININTASAHVLQLIPGVDENMASAIVSGRGGEDDGTGLLGPYRSVDQVRRVPEIRPELARILQQYCDVRSRTFEVEVDAQISGYHRKFIAVVGRNNPRDIQVLTFYWK
jgi:general secretion pathway protein K